MGLTFLKHGPLFRPDGSQPWMESHAQCPFPLVMDDVVRVYFCTRPPQTSDGMFTSCGAFVDLDRSDLTRILRVSSQPAIQPGGPGDFDQFGAMPGSVVAHEGKHYMFYCGWVRRLGVPYNWSIGLAISDNDGETFSRHGKGPLLGPTLDEPYLQACPIVRIINGQWHMWYLSGLRWVPAGSKHESVYVIMHASSSDGLHWQREAKPLISTVVEDECQTSPSVFRANGRYHMLFSYRHGTNFRNAQRGYRIGYAWSEDLLQWHRDDTQVKLSPSEEPDTWDSEMVCYPAVAEIDGQLWCFYCGNGFGKEGFGLAECFCDLPHASAPSVQAPDSPQVSKGMASCSILPE
jgi:hypothetical protein